MLSYRNRTTCYTIALHFTVKIAWGVQSFGKKKTTPCERVLISHDAITIKSAKIYEGQGTHDARYMQDLYHDWDRG